MPWGELEARCVRGMCWRSALHSGHPTPTSALPHQAWGALATVRPSLCIPFPEALRPKCKREASRSMECQWHATAGPGDPDPDPGGSFVSRRSPAKDPLRLPGHAPPTEPVQVVTVHSTHLRLSY